jgi:asparagine synthase (glutamine-hydrolysing)
MCRIAGVINKSIGISSVEAMVKEMCRLRTHENPTEEDIYVNPENNFAQGGRRSSIIDLSFDKYQPASYKNNGYHISYDGRLYNNLELKEELTKAGCYLNDQSDKEIILAAFATWGTKAFARFNGMFAFALWDNNTNDLYLVRDSIGMKPLYYAHTSEGLAFASEIKAFKAIPYLQQKNNKAQVYLMAYGYLPEPITTLKEVKPLEKGTWLKYNISSLAIEINVFRQYSYFEKITNREEAISRIKRVCSSTVERHLLSDSAVGIVNDGEINSTIVKLLAPHLKEFSVIAGDKDYSERVTQNISSSQQLDLITATDFHQHLPEIVDAMDLPSCGGINEWYTGKYAKENGLKVMLSVIGSDELYGGYPSFNRMKTTLVLKKIPNKILRAGANSSSKKIRRMSYLSIDGTIGKYLFLKGKFVPSEIARYLNADEVEVWKILEEEPHLKNIEFLTAGNQASWMEYNLSMQDQLLRDADVMGRAHGVEIRFPFLDSLFVNLSLQIGSALKYSRLGEKRLLIDSFKDTLSPSISDRSKHTQLLPFKKWFGDDRYVKSSNGKYMGEYLAKMRSDDMDWEHFFTLLLIEK